VQKWGRSAVEVEQAILDAGERAAWDLRRFLRGINGIAKVSPLLGLFGTVVGMIQSFDSIATVDSTMADQKALIATGISVALITTAAGLTVAIPALVSHLCITGMVDRRIMELDSLGMKVVNLVSAEALGQDAARSSRKAKAA
jgi:biopolymer transport protein ExbB